MMRLSDWNSGLLHGTILGAAGMLVQFHVLLRPAPKAPTVAAAAIVVLGTAALVATLYGHAVRSQA
jgi:hypothetical protein